jgi:hypothetical protein
MAPASDRNDRARRPDDPRRRRDDVSRKRVGAPRQRADPWGDREKEPRHRDASMGYRGDRARSTRGRSSDPVRTDRCPRWLGGSFPIARAVVALTGRVVPFAATVVSTTRSSTSMTGRVVMVTARPNRRMGFPRPMTRLPNAMTGRVGPIAPLGVAIARPVVRLTGVAKKNRHASCRFLGSQTGKTTSR